MPGLSIVIPTLNEEQYLPKCLELIKQHASDLNRIEIIVVDAGSEDETRNTLSADINLLSVPDYAGHKYKSLINRVLDVYDLDKSS